jgi:hypothetical protein
VIQTPLDDILCKPILMDGDPIPFCELGETPLVAISAHSVPFWVLASAHVALEKGHVGAFLWEVPPDGTVDHLAVTLNVFTKVRANSPFPRTL